MASEAVKVRVSRYKRFLIPRHYSTLTLPALLERLPDVVGVDDNGNILLAETLEGKSDRTLCKHLLRLTIFHFLSTEEERANLLEGVNLTSGQKVKVVNKDTSGTIDKMNEYGKVDVDLENGSKKSFDHTELQPVTKKRTADGITQDEPESSSKRVRTHDQVHTEQTQPEAAARESDSPPGNACTDEHDQFHTEQTQPEAAALEAPETASAEEHDDPATAPINTTVVGQHSDDTEGVAVDNAPMPFEEEPASQPQSPPPQPKWSCALNEDEGEDWEGSPFVSCSCAPCM